MWFCEVLVFGSVKCLFRDCFLFFVVCFEALLLPSMFMLCMFSFSVRYCFAIYSYVFLSIICSVLCVVVIFVMFLCYNVYLCFMLFMYMDYGFESLFVWWFVLVSSEDRLGRFIVGYQKFMLRRVLSLVVYWRVVC